MPSLWHIIQPSHGRGARLYPQTQPVLTGRGLYKICTPGTQNPSSSPRNQMVQVKNKAGPRGRKRDDSHSRAMRGNFRTLQLLATRLRGTRQEWLFDQRRTKDREVYQEGKQNVWWLSGEVEKPQAKHQWVDLEIIWTHVFCEWGWGRPHEGCHVG